MNQVNETQPSNKEKGQSNIPTVSQLEFLDDSEAIKVKEQQAGDIKTLSGEFETQKPRRANIKLIEGFFGTEDTAPTYVPKNLYQAVKIFDDKFYIYDTKNQQWVHTVTSSTSNYRSGAFEINTTGSISVTTVPFTPSYIKITAYPQQTEQSESVGTKTTGSNSSLLYKYYDGAKLVAESDEATSDLVAIFPDGGGSATLVSWTSFNADGFTINCTACPVLIDILWEVWG